MDNALTMGPLMLDLEGLVVHPSEVAKLKHPCTGGVILFSRNYDSPEQVTSLVTEIRSIRGAEFLIAVDQEGGRVQRFLDGFTRLPPACRYAEVDADGYLQSIKVAEASGWLMASELLSVGVDFSFAPVLDVDCGISSVIGDRSFSRDPEVVAQMASAFRKGMRRAGMAAIGKHFPGHGSVAADSHLDLPLDDRELSVILAGDVLPFKQLIDEGLEGVMPAHVVYSAVDSKPAGFSEYWIKDVLRKQLGFHGAVFSDDLSMAGAEFAGGFVARAQLALRAGCDMVLVCNRPEQAEQLLDKLPSATTESTQRRLIKLRGRNQFSRAELLRSYEWREASTLIESLEGTG